MLYYQVMYYAEEAKKELSHAAATAIDLFCHIWMIRIMISIFPLQGKLLTNIFANW
jgi:hypothetical protein